MLEIRFRAFHGCAVWKKFARAVTRDLGLPPSRHLLIGVASILSKILYLAGFWPPVPAAKSAPLHRLWVDIVRECYGAKRVAGPEPETDLEALARAGAPTLAALLRTARLTYVVQLAKECPPTPPPTHPHAGGSSSEPRKLGRPMAHGRH